MTHLTQKTKKRSARERDTWRFRQLSPVVLRFRAPEGAAWPTRLLRLIATSTVTRLGEWLVLWER